MPHSWPSFFLRAERLITLAVLSALGANLALSAAAPATPPFRIGLNDVFIGNDTLTTDQQLALFKETGVAGLRHFQPNDVQWSSVQGTNRLFTFTQADSVMASSYGFGFLPTFYGNSTQNYYVPPGTASTATWSAATYGTQTTTYLQTVVNRYKNATRYWEIGNEINTKTTPPAGFSAADYATFLIYNRTAIRAADSSAQVVIAGELGNYGYPIANAYQWLRDVLAAGGAAGFDVFNFHDYKSWWTLPTHYDQYRSILDANGLQSTPIWVTETAQASAISNANINPAYASVDGQAADVWRRPCVLFGKGVQTVFWHSFWANPSDTSGFHDMGLVNSATGIRKKAWHSFKLLNQKIEGFASATLVSTGVTNDDNVTGGTGAWVVRFDFADGTKRWVAWSPDGQSTTLTGLTNVTSVNLTTVVPATLSTDGVTATWTTSTRSVTGGTLTVTLTDAPVLIEIAATTPTSTAPTISTHPASQTIATGASATFSVVATGTAPLSYQWLKNGTTISGATSTSYIVTSATVESSSGNYSVTVTNTAGSVTSNAATLTVTAPLFAPVISTSPSSQSVIAGANVTFSVAATGTTPLTYHWLKDGATVTGATSASYTITPATNASAGNYAVTVTNTAGSVTSTAATLTVSAPPVAPALSTAPAAQTVTAGTGATFTVVVTGTAPFTYQWLRNNVPLAGVTAASYVIATVTSADAGNYSVTVTNSVGTVTSSAATLTVNPAAYLSNLSVRTTLAAAQIVTVGLVVGGGAKPVLLRAAGPSLAGFGLTTAMSDPRLELYQGTTKIAENDNWTATLSATFSALGAFAFSPASKDAALLQTLGGAYTVQTTGTAAGLVLVEGYDAGPASAARLINVSARNRVGTGADILIAGFNITGTGTLRVLIRGIGPTLSGFGVTGPLADPKLELYDANSVKITESDDWAASLATTFTAVGAFALPTGSKDAALLATLTAGKSYTVQVSGIANTTGEALVEIYEVP